MYTYSKRENYYMTFRYYNTPMRIVFSSFLLICIIFWFGSAQFSDIDLNTQYGKSIVWLNALWVVKWYPDGEFKPQQSVTRAEMMKIVLEASVGSSLDSNWSNCFSDVTDQRYAKYVCYAQQQWMIKGYPDGSFGVDNQVTVAEWLKIAINAFTDRIAEWEGIQRYQPYFEFVHTNNIFSKYALNPNRPMSRGEVSEIVYLLYQESNGKHEFIWVRDSRSPWCFASSNSPTPPTSIFVEWQQRTLLVDVWRQVKHSTPAPLTVAFHGRTNSNQQVRGYYKVQREANGEWIWVYPSGLPENTSPRSWSRWWDPYAIFDEIVKTYSEQYCVDMDRIYVIGHSLGAWAANSVACKRGDVVRASGTIGWSVANTECTWPTASFIAHNPEDRLAAFSWWERARDVALNRNSCTTQSFPYLEWPRDGNCIQYVCQQWASVVRCPHSDSTAYNWNYYPHTRPDFAWQAIWEFFEENS